MLNVQISAASGIKQIFTSDAPLKIHKLHDQIKGLAVCNRVT